MREYSTERMQAWHRTPRGWQMMCYEKNGKMVCRYYYPESASHE